MFKRLFQFSTLADADNRNGTLSDGSLNHALAVAGSADDETVAVPLDIPSGGLDATRSASAPTSFEEIYRNAEVKPSKAAYNILKIAEMVNSQHLAALSPEAKRGSLLMALDAAGVHVEDLLQDALIRQRALNEYEEVQQRKLDDFEAAKNRQNSAIQADLDRITAEHMSRVHANLDQVARQQDTLRAWKRRKQAESQQIAEAAQFCTPQANAAGASNLTAMLARCGGEPITGRKL